ncbi:MAG TPA: hypothetical protein VNH83_21360, partial [Bryobacteraceae bacterium]|nr:hypothetical protein [Bryobacteraceae bacterium]
ILVQAQFTTGTAYFWSGRGTLVWNGHSYAGIGSFLGFAMVEEGTDVAARGITLQISGIDPGLLADALQDLRQGAPITVCLALFDDTGTLIADPIASWSGALDQPTIQISGDQATIDLACESELVDMNTSVERRYTHDDQQIDNSGDLGFQFVNGLQEITTYWGRVPSSSNNI